MKTLQLLASVLVAALLVPSVLSLPGGPPLNAGSFDNICNRMMPIHSGNDEQSGSGGYIVSPNMPRFGSTGFNYTAGQNYTVRLTGSATFRGFLVIAHVPGATGMVLGRFIPRNNNQQTLDCDGVGANTAGTVTHNNADRTDFTSMTFTWEAPSDSDGIVDFRYTVLASFSVFYVRQSAAANADLYRLNFTTPANCNRSQCLTFIGINTNPFNSSYLDIYMEGTADGWVAVGFSDTRSMALADVVACNRNGATGAIEALDTWNIAGYNNEVDDIQDVQLVSGSYVGGRISCSVTKRIAPSGTGQDLDLNNDYYVLYGRRRGNSGSGMLIRHEIGQGNNPSITSERVNPVTDGGTVPVNEFPRMALLRFHGILMLIAWPLLAKCGIFFAQWMRHALPNGEWFQVHRAFLLTSMFIGAAGFAVAFIANYPSGLIPFQNNSTGTAHFAIGIIVMALQIANPIIAIFRCKPTGSNRWIFNILHGALVGSIGTALAITNVALGTSLIFRSLSAAFWVFIAYVIFDFSAYVALTIIFTVKSCVSDDPDRKKLAPPLTECCISGENEECNKKEETEMQQAGAEKTEKDEEKPKKEPSKDSPLRWASLIVYLVVAVSLVVVTIVLVAAL